MADPDEQPGPRVGRKPTSISKLTYLIPFGRYAGSMEVEPRADEVLVGREGHRAYFVDLLIGAGRKGAFLVTGRRGAGKTSFVRHCIAEYEKSVFRRFLRNSIGHAFWDRVVVVLFLSLLLVCGVLLSELAQLIAPLTVGGPHALLRWLVLVPIGIILLYPCVYARGAVEVVLESRHEFEDHESRADTRPARFPWLKLVALLAVTALVLVAWPVSGVMVGVWTPVIALATALFLGFLGIELLQSAGRNRSKGTRFSPIFSTLVVVAAVGFLWILRGLYPPVWTAGALFGGLSTLYLGVQGLSFAPALDRSTESSSDQGNNEPRRSPWTSAFVRIGWIVLLLFLASCWIGSSFDMPKDPSNPWETFRASSMLNVWTGLFFLGIGLLLRGIYQHDYSLHALRRHQPEGDPHRSVALTSVRNALRRGGANYLWPGLGLALAATSLALHEVGSGMAHWGYLVATGLVSALVAAPLVISSYFKKPDSEAPLHTFRPASRSILLAGALISVVLALQLAEPVLKPIQVFVAQDGEGILLKTANKVGTWFSGLPGVQNYPISLAAVPGLSKTGNERQIEGWPLLASRDETLLWIGLILAVLILLFFIQYEWVVRPHVQTREGDPPDLKEHPPWEDPEILESTVAERWSLHRKMAALTLPWATYRIWLPSLAISVNLGLDSKMGTGQVIQAMLVGLRDRYHRTFTAWTAGPANLGRLTVFLIILAIVNLAGDTWFKLPATVEVAGWSSDVARLVPEEERNPVLRGASACQILAVTEKVRPVVFADLACNLGEGWFELFYLDLVPDSLKGVSRAPLQGSPYLLRPLPEWVGLASFPILMPWPSPEVHILEVGPNQPGDRLLLYTLLPYREPRSGPWDVETAGLSYRDPLYLPHRWNELLPAGVHLNVYHLLLFFLALMITRSLFRKLPILPYHRNLQQIDDLLDSMTARTRVTQRPTIWEPARWVYSLMADRVRETEREPLDNRTIELAFLHILEDIQKGGIRMPGLARSHLNLPSPEITFTFDELDKLETRPDPEEKGASSVGAELRALQADQERTVRLRGLLSDLKNILASAPARFVFIGGRNLYDEWLADQTARQPLLTNIFTAQVYLPSLLTDRHREPLERKGSGHSKVRQGPHRLHFRIEEYVIHQYRRSQELYKKLMLDSFRPTFGLSPVSFSHERFAVGIERESLFMKLSPLPIPSWTRPTRLVRVQEDDQMNGVEDCEAKALLHDFLAFLTLRSMGNPKRLKELLASFMRPLESELAPEDRWKLPCKHVLRLRDQEVFRIQLIASIYRQLAGTFESRMVGRDDKMATSIFFLSDFLFKFHRRAFSWANLERVDELAHIHRAPDLRELQEEMVDQMSERVLHRVLNGMYSFRFRSDVAREVEYLSRRSAPEMAALNFTLDESQSLKAIYHNHLTQREQGEGLNPSLVAGLGELYEFDQELETARYYYRRAIDLLDDRLKEKTGSPTVVRNLLRGRTEELGDARIFLPWGEARLRLMLQIGMTYEMARNLEHAVTEYRTARTLARALVKACLAQEDPEKSSWLINRLAPWREPTPTGRHHTLKHLSILFQPLFAEAWASEKMAGTIDTSNAHLEAGLWKLRSLLPFARESRIKRSKNPTMPPHANLSLTLSQLHNKAGDLYFFKGRQSLSWRRMTSRRFWLRMLDPNQPRDSDTDGYLLRAHYHYAVSLHDIRRYWFHRIESSQYRLSLASDGGKTLASDALPNFLQQAVASSVNDMAEATLGRVSLFGLLGSLYQNQLPNAPEEEDLKPLLLKWLKLRDSGTRRRPRIFRIIGGTGESMPDRLILRDLNHHSASLANWLGEWNVGMRLRDGKRPLIKFTGPDSPVARFHMAVHLCRAGAGFFRSGGYLEDAGREMLQACWIVSRMLWWFRTVKTFEQWLRRVRCCDDPVNHAERKMAESLAALNEAVFGEQVPSTRIEERYRILALYLVEQAVEMLEEAQDLFSQSRYRTLTGSNDGQDIDQHGLQSYDVVPSDVLTLVCNLGLWLKDQKGNEVDELRKRIQALATCCQGTAVQSSDFAERLRMSLRWKRYPILNRLNGLQTLVDAHVLGPPAGANHEQAKSDLLDLLDLNEQYAAPLHFTPQQLGTTCALFWLRWVKEDREQDHGTERIFRTAQRHLRMSEEMCTLQRPFYETIANLFYLYDDFNDRQIHFKYALQMAGTELTTLLRQLLKEVRQVTSAPAAGGTTTQGRGAATAPPAGNGG